MYNLIPQLLVIISLASILVILGKKLPSALGTMKEGGLESELDSASSLWGKFPQIAASEYQRHFFVIAEKFLRRSVIFSLKVGNLAHRWMRTVKERSEKIPIPYLDELTRERSEESFTEREKEFIEMIRKNPKNSDAYRGLGDLYLEEGNARDARLSFAEVLKLNPEDGHAKERLAEIGEEENNDNESRPG